LRSRRSDRVPGRESRLRDAVAGRLEARGTIGDLTPDDGQGNAELRDSLGRSRVEVAVENDEVGELADLDRAEAVLGEIRSRGIQRASSDRFVEREALFGP